MSLGLGIICAASGCSSYGVRPHSPAQGGPAWVEVSSAHFRVITDLSSADAQGVAREFENELEAVDQVEFEHPRTATEPTTVVVFSSASDFHAFVPNLVDGEFRRSLPGDLEPARYVLLHGAVTADTRVTCMHEMTHDLFERNFGPAPPWLNEGWAQYYSTIDVGPDKLRVGGALPHLTFTFGGAPFHGRSTDGSYMLAMPVDQVPPPSQLLAMDRKTFYAFSKEQDVEGEGHLKGIAVYMGAWALVHMMHDGPESYRVRYKRFLEKVRDSQVQPAWDSAFAGVSPADFDRDFRTYLSAREVTLYEYPRQHADTQELATTNRVMSDAEVRILWSRLSPKGGPAEVAAQQDLDAAVREAPDSPDGYYYRGLFSLHHQQLANAETDLVKAVQLAPTDPRYLTGVVELRLKQALQKKNGSAGPIKEALEPLAAVATSAVQFRVVALIYNQLGQHEKALPFAQHATALAPIDSDCLDVEAQVLSSLGRNHEALQSQRAAVAFLPEGAAAPGILKRLKTYEDRERSAP